MRVLMITALDVWALSGQGGAPSLFKTLEAYGKRGHEVDVIAATVGANHHHGEPPLEPPDLPGVTFHRFHLPSLAESRLRLPATALMADQKLRFALTFPWLASRRALRLARPKRFDLLYGYEVHGVLAQRLLRRALRGERRPLLVARFQGTIMHPYLDDRWQLLRRREEVMALQTAAELYVMTDDGTQGDEVLARLNPASAGKVRFWRNGLDLDHVRPPNEAEAAGARERLGIGLGDFVMVTAARLASWKRIDRAIDALALLRPDVPGARLFVVGDGEERANLEALATRRGVTDAVTFTGGVPQPDVLRYLWAADVFLSVNELSNLGNPLLEAMSAARCILTLDEGDTRDLVRDGLTGRLLPPGSEAAAIATALRELAADQSSRRVLGDGAGEYARANFWSWDRRMEAELTEVEALVTEPRQAVAADV